MRHIKENAATRFLKLQKCVYFETSPDNEECSYSSSYTCVDEHLSAENRQ